MVAVAVVLLTIAAPSMRELIARQRLKSVNAELVTDLQYARTLGGLAKPVRSSVKFQDSAGDELLRGVRAHARSAVATAPTRRAGCLRAGRQTRSCARRRSRAAPTCRSLNTRPSRPPHGLLIFTVGRACAPSPRDYVLMTSRISGCLGSVAVTVNADGSAHGLLRRTRSVPGVPGVPELAASRHAAPVAQRGLSLVELMVGVAIGLFVVAGAATVAPPSLPTRAGWSSRRRFSRTCERLPTS